jgi:hypothetical protein
VEWLKVACYFIWRIKMYKEIFDALLAIALLIIIIKWWLRAKGTTYRKFILATGIFWIITVMSFYLAVNFHLVDCQLLI